MYSNITASGYRVPIPSTDTDAATATKEDEKKHSHTHYTQMKSIKKLLTLLFCILIFFGLYAQHEISLDGGSGISMMLYKSDVGKRQISIGYAGGLSYTYFSENRIVAFRIGLEATNYEAALQLNSMKDAYDTRDMDGEPINFRYTVNDYSEKISALYLQIPLFLQFMNRGNDLISKHRFYADLGFKIGVPISAELNISSMNMTSSGYYYNYENEIFMPKFMGYGNFDLEVTAPSKIKMGVSVLASVELGMRWHLYHNTLFLYTGLYCDYGLNSISPASTNNQENYHLINYNPEDPTVFTGNSLLFAKETTSQGDVVQMVKRVAPLAAGLRIRIGIFIEKPADKMKWARRL
ncbi:MAG: PorT family protein [Bacteroidales bacterium]|nr:PorT family protein [Bacteroidales bacterium]